MVRRPGSLDLLLLVVLSWVPTGAQAASRQGAPPPAAAAAARGKIGVEIRKTYRAVEVVRVLPMSPADRAGLMAGDGIVAVDGHDVTGETVEKAASRIIGPAGTRVTLTVRRGGSELDLVVKRELLGAAINDALADPAIAAQVRRLIKVQGGRRAIDAISGVDLLLAGRGPGGLLLRVTASGARALRCGGSSRTVAGGPRHGLAPRLARFFARSGQTHRPVATALPNLRVIHFARRGDHLRYLGERRLRRRTKTLALPRLVYRFRYEGTTYDFDSAGHLVRVALRRGDELFFGGYRRVRGLLVPGAISAGGKKLRLGVGLRTAARASAAAVGSICGAP